MNRAYILNWEYEHIGDAGKDAMHLPFEGDLEFSARMLGTEKFKHPTEIYFQADFSVLGNLDYLVTDLNVPIMSQKMIDVFISLGLSNYRLIPTILIDDTYFGELFDQSNTILPTVPINSNYFIIQLTTYTNAFDYDNSDYKDSAAIPGMLRVRKLVLRRSESNFPSLFRIKESSSKLFISHEAKIALEVSKINGYQLGAVDVSDFKY